MASDTSSAHDFLPLHPEAFRILTVLHERELHGYAVVKELERDPGRPGKVLPANLYRRLRTLLAQGLILEVEAPTDESDADERRRYFAISPLGRDVARAEVQRMEGLLLEARAVLGG
jgi:DNA-binding PadR family transcriptional regulator